MAARALFSIFRNRRREGFPVLSAAWAQIAQKASPATEDQPERANGWLQSRTIWSAVIGFGCFVALQIGVGEQWIETTLTVAEALGFGGAAVYRALGRSPMRED